MKSCVCVLGPIPSLLVLRSPRGNQGLLQRYMIFSLIRSYPFFLFASCFSGCLLIALLYRFFCFVHLSFFRSFCLPFMVVEYPYLGCL